MGLVLNAFLYQGWPGLKFALLGFALSFGLYFGLYVVRAMGAGDVKLMGAVGAMVGWQDWFGIFVITAVIGGVMGIILAISKKRAKSTLFNVGVILNEMKHGRAAYVTKPELDVKNPNSLGLPHGAVIAVGTLFFLAVSAHYTH